MPLWGYVLSAPGCLRTAVGALGMTCAIQQLAWLFEHPIAAACLTVLPCEAPHFLAAQVPQMTGVSPGAVPPLLSNASAADYPPLAVPMLLLWKTENQKIW